MRHLRTKSDTSEMRTEMHLTRPPRLEGKVKNAKQKPKKKPKHVKPKQPKARKSQTYSAKERKDYQLRSKNTNK